MLMVGSKKFPDMLVVEDHAGLVKVVFASLQHDRDLFLVDMLGYECE